MSKNLTIFVPDLGCAYKWSEEHKVLLWNPLYVNNIMDEDEWGPVEEDKVGEELVSYNGKQVQLSDVYRDIELKLGVKK